MRFIGVDDIRAVKRSVSVAATGEICCGQHLSCARLTAFDCAGWLLLRVAGA